MTRKPSYEELENRIRELEKEAGKHNEVEEELRKYQLMVESAHDAIFFKDLGSRYISVNNKTLEAFGLPREDVIGKNDYELLSDRKEAKKNVHDDQIVFTSGKSTDIFKHMTGADGKEYWFQAIKVPQFNNDGKVIGLVGIARDITKQKRIEEALRESEEKYRNLIERANDGIIIVQDGIVEFVNNRMTDLIGYSVGEMCDTPFLDYVFPDDRKRIKELHERRLKGEDVPDIYEMKVLHKDGRKLDIETNSGIITYNGKPSVLAFVRDITDRKQAELVLTKKRKELENKTHELEEVNAALKVLLKQRDEDKKEFEEKVIANVKKLVLPYFEKLNNSQLNDKQMVYLNIVKSNLEDIITPFVNQLSSKYSDLTPSEIQIAGLIKDGKTTKEIAELLNSSTGTIDFHRNNLRKKLGLRNTKANLRTFLLSHT